MHLFYDILPVFLFFLAFKFFGIYVATVVGIAATFAQVVMTRLFRKKWDKTQVITFCVFVFFGSMTLYFHDPIFVKWKPTIIFWIFALVILGSQIFTSTPIMQRLMQNVIQEKGGEVPKKVWRNVNILWAFFFLVMGSINLYIAYNFDDAAWVNFKFYGITSALFVFSVLQSFYLLRYLSDHKE